MNCPRCNCLMVDSYGEFACNHCSLSYSMLYNYYYIDHIISMHDTLYWFPDNQECWYYSADRSRSIKLPFLPYDISLSKIKQYLVFA